MNVVVVLMWDDLREGITHTRVSVCVCVCTCALCDATHVSEHVPLCVRVYTCPYVFTCECMYVSLHGCLCANACPCTWVFVCVKGPVSASPP